MLPWSLNVFLSFRCISRFGKTTNMRDHSLQCVCVCHNKKKVPDEWQARQAIPAILQVSSSKHNANKNTTRGRGLFHQPITVLSSSQEKKEEQLLILHMLQSTCFGTKIEIGVDSKANSVCVCVCERERVRGRVWEVVWKHAPWCYGVS